MGRNAGDLLAIIPLEGEVPFAGGWGWGSGLRSRAPTSPDLRMGLSWALEQSDLYVRARRQGGAIVGFLG